MCILTERHFCSILIVLLCVVTVHSLSPMVSFSLMLFAAV